MMNNSLRDMIEVGDISVFIDDMMVKTEMKNVCRRLEK